MWGWTARKEGRREGARRGDRRQFHTPLQLIFAFITMCSAAHRHALKKTTKRKKHFVMSCDGIKRQKLESFSSSVAENKPENTEEKPISNPASFNRLDSPRFTAQTAVKTHNATPATSLKRHSEHVLSARDNRGCECKPPLKLNNRWISIGGKLKAARLCKQTVGKLCANRVSIAFRWGDEVS